MSTGNGFLTFSPTERYGASTALSKILMQKFTAPESGNLYISEIGLWAEGGAGTTLHLRMAIFDDDSVNVCPNTIIENSDSGELSVSGVDVVKVNHIYATQPIVVGGNVYWIGEFANETWGALSTKSGDTGVGVRQTPAMGNPIYPTWPSPDAWHTHYDETSVGRSFYVVYGTEAQTFTPKYMRHGKYFKDGVKQRFKWAK